MVLLSICIPTYNRAKYLDITLNRITQEDIFLNTDKIEIVISDKLYALFMNLPIINMGLKNV